ncbi:MAG TPA: hypothetical protein VHP63_05880, partial [candidate division Zixibacteria bacterium]|nr:hypothetical protein [candidate division Zixibacteria bacterium]
MKRTLSVILLLFLMPGFSHGIELDSLITKSVGGPKAIERIKSLRSYQMTGKINWNGLDGKYSGKVKMPNLV